MDKTSKKIIKFMKKTPDEILWYSDEPYRKLDLSEDEFYRCVRYLSSINLIEFATNQDNVHLGIALTHSSVHSFEIKRDAFFSWFFHTFVGGVITGVVTTLLAEGAIYLCVKLIQLLHQ